MKEWYNNLNLRSYNAVFNFTNGGRNVGKSSAWKITAVLSFVNHGHCTVWARRTAEQVRACSASPSVFFKHDLLPLMGGVTLEDLRIRGDYAYIKDGKKWRPFINFCALSQPATERGADGLNYRHMILDEYTAIPADYARFQGDECRNLFDIFFSKKRTNPMRLYCLGNREAYSNPYYNYLGISPPPVGKIGITRYKNNTIAVEDLGLSFDAGDATFDAAIMALSGTPYGDFMTNGASDGGGIWHIAKTPKGAEFYTNVYLSGVGGFKIFAHNSAFYVSRNCDASKLVFTDTAITPYPLVYALSPSNRRWFSALTFAAKINNVYFDTPQTCEAWQKIRTLLCDK